MTRNYPVPPAVTFDAVGSGGHLQLKQRTYLIRLKTTELPRSKTATVLLYVIKKLFCNYFTELICAEYNILQSVSLRKVLLRLLLL